jgi:hypothetical protein
VADAAKRKLEHRFGGRITKRYLFRLTVAHRIDEVPLAQ